MADLIDRQALLGFLDDITNDEEWLVNQYNADWIYSWIDFAPSVDAVEVPTDNVDDISRAVIGIGIFRLSFCLNVQETELQGEPVFRCVECPFENKETRKCAVKMFLKTRATKEQWDKFSPIL